MHRLLPLCALFFAAPSFAAQKTDVLLITDQSLAKAWQPFARWKTELGKFTRIVTVQDIEKKSQGADIQEKMRAYILECIQTDNTRWVILGGDSQPSGKGHVPDRDTHHPMMRYKDIPTDVYYISPKNWDTNGDQVYGDWENDRADIAYTNGSVSIGRIPVRTPDDVSAYTEKVKEYEMHYPEDAFATQFIYNCPEPSAYPKLRTSGQEVKSNWSHGQVDRLFSPKSPDKESLLQKGPLTEHIWKEKFDGKVAGKWHMHGHGLLPVWVLDGKETVNPKTVATLKNKGAYPVMTTVSCFTGHFDDKADPSIAEAMLRKPEGGAIAIIAPAREGVPVFADRNDFRLMMTEGKMDGTTRILTRFWTNGLKKNLTIGEAWAEAHRALEEDARNHPGFHWCQSEINLLGDPTLDIRSAKPTSPTIDAPKSIALGKQTVEIQTQSTGATVCLYMPDHIFEKAQADKTGRASFTLDLTNSGSLMVTVSGPNLNARQATIIVK